MNEQEIKKLIEIHGNYKQDRDKLLDRITGLEKAIEGIAAVLRHEGQSFAHEVTDKKPPAVIRSGQFVVQTKLIDTIRSQLPLLPNLFTVREVTDCLMKKFPVMQADNRLASVSSSLRRLAELKEITLIRLGSGKRASTFTVPANEKNLLSA